MSKLYASLAGDKGQREVSRSGDEWIEIHLSAFGKKLGMIVLETLTDADGKANQYLLRYGWSTGQMKYQGEEWGIIEEGHRKEGIIQRMTKG